MAKEKLETVDLSADPDPLPKAGDKVDYVLPDSRKTTEVVVAAVPTEHKGRVVTIDVTKPDDKAKRVIHVPHRPKGALAGNTWHWAATVLILAVLSLCLTASAALPTYHTLTAYGNRANPSTIIFPADPNSQIRLINVFYGADTNTAALQLSSGVTAYTLMATNTSTSAITNLIDSTNGLAGASWLVLQHNGTCYTNAIASAGWGSYITGTNTFGVTQYQPFVVIGTGGWGIATSVGDNLYQMGPVSSIPVGMATNSLNGDDIFSANYGRPLLLQLTPAYATNMLYTASTHYDSQSQ
ncbi:MAG: hypothetical protein ABSG59_18290 [Verrucomicrobiota bacterium]|jgi:hypothetical protein